MTDDDRPGGGFLQRWSARKLAPPDSDAAVTATAPAGSPPAPADADMPPLDSLDEQSDFSGFLSPRVSETLRRQALRKLFHLPSFNVTDGLDDYDEDYTRPAVLADWMRDRLAARATGGETPRRETPVRADAVPPPAEAGEPDDGEVQAAGDESAGSPRGGNEAREDAPWQRDRT